MGEWQGRREPMEDSICDALKLDDYVHRELQQRERPPVNFYVAFYESQRKGRSVHSPRSCMPGGGWMIRSFEPKMLMSAGPAGARQSRCHRARHAATDRLLLVPAAWPRAYTNEYLVKWYIFWDALTRNRTDGALVRLSAPVMTGHGEARTDAQMRRTSRPSPSGSEILHSRLIRDPHRRTGARGGPARRHPRGRSEFHLLATLRG